MVVKKETAKYSLKNLYQSKTRSFLTILSIFVGITTIFIFVSFGIGLYAYVNEFASGSSADKLIILPKGAGAPGLDDTFALSDDDLDAIKQVSGVYEVSGMYIRATEIQQDKIKKYTFIIGYDPEKSSLIWEGFGDIDLAKGDWLKNSDSSKVLLGYNYQIKDRIFPKAYEVNDKIEIQGQDFRIVGFVESIGNPQDDAQIYTTKDEMQELYSDLKGYNMIIAEVDADKIDIIAGRVERALRNSRDLDEGKEDFFVQSWQDMMETYSIVLNVIIGFIILIAFIAVLVSMINTANTMVTSVLERTKEIGIMKAVGARNSEIFGVFLFESSVLGFIAGVIGVTFGWIISAAIGAAMNSLGWGFLSPYFSWWLFAALIAFATITGAVSGTIPAIQASRVNPVDALRYE